MYPDPEHFYEDDSAAICEANIHDEKFMECLVTNDVVSNDTTNDKYMGCLKEKENRYKKCNEEKGYDFVLRRHFNRTRPTKCDKFNVVYSLTKVESNFLKPYDECSRPFVVQRIAHSNLILLITNNHCSQAYMPRDFEEVPQTVDYGNYSTFCHKMKTESFFRSRPKNCTTHHVNVSSITFI